MHGYSSRSRRRHREPGRGTGRDVVQIPCLSHSKGGRTALLCVTPICRSSLLPVFVLAAFGAILQGSLFGLAGLLPVSYTAPIMSGQGMAGTFAALAMICAIASE